MKFIQLLLKLLISLLRCYYCYGSSNINDNKNNNYYHDYNNNIETSSSSSTIVEEVSTKSRIEANNDNDNKVYNPLKEIELRVSDKITTFLQQPIDACGILSNYRSVNGFTNDLLSPDRDNALQFLFTLKQQYPQVSVYYALEDGTFLSYSDDLTYASYREPGQSGYNIINNITSINNDNDSTNNTSTSTNTITNASSNNISSSSNNNNLLYLNDCVNEMTGDTEQCIINSIDVPYVQCNYNSSEGRNGNDSSSSCPELIKCPDLQSQRNCSNLINTNTTEYKSLYNKCIQNIKWCPSYTIQNATIQNIEYKQLGYIPRTYHCINTNGQITQGINNDVVKSRITTTTTTTSNNNDESILIEYGNCTYQNGNLVNRSTIIGPYAYCGKNTTATTSNNNNNNNICSTTYIGGYQSRNYDPRVREWYTIVKEYQTNIWSKPYPFIFTLNMGITYGQPIYQITTNTNNNKNMHDSSSSSTSTMNMNQNIFAGVIAADIQLSGISTFLEEQYPSPLDISSSSPNDNNNNNNNNDNTITINDDIMTSSSSSSSSSSFNPLVGIVEAVEPYYIIGLSTGTSPAKTVRIIDNNNNNTIPCTENDDDDQSNDCITVRVSILELAVEVNNNNNDNDENNNNDDYRLDDALLRRAFIALQNAGFPDPINNNNNNNNNNSNNTSSSNSNSKLKNNNDNALNELGWVSVREDDNDITSNAYVASSILYGDTTNTNNNNDTLDSNDSSLFLGIQWRIIVLLPMEKSYNDTVTYNENLTLFILVIVLGSIGFICCFTLTYMFYSYRKERIMIHADWRFTCLFLLGCTLIQLSIFTNVGNNTNVTCLLRPWSLHLCIVIAFSPLLIKVWRMYVLIGKSQKFIRKSISHLQAALYTLPIIGIQFILLLIFSFIDPPIPTEHIETNGLIATQHITCQRSKSYFLWFQIMFDASLLGIGCVLAYLTRNLDPKFGEAKQLIFAMYNIAFTAIVIGGLLVLVPMDVSSEIIFKTVGIFWGSLISSCAFVMPRVMQVKRESISTTTTTTAAIHSFQQQQQQQRQTYYSTAMFTNNSNAFVCEKCKGNDSNYNYNNNNRNTTSLPSTAVTSGLSSMPLMETSELISTNTSSALYDVIPTNEKTMTSLSPSSLIATTATNYDDHIPDNNNGMIHNDERHTTIRRDEKNNEDGSQAVGAHERNRLLSGNDDNTNKISINENHREEEKLETLNIIPLATMNSIDKVPTCNNETTSVAMIESPKPQTDHTKEQKVGNDGEDIGHSCSNASAQAVNEKAKLGLDTALDGTMVTDGHDSDGKKKGGKVRVIVRARVRRATPDESNNNQVEDKICKTDETKEECKMVDDSTKLLLPVAANNNKNDDSIEKVYPLNTEFEDCKNDDHKDLEEGTSTPTTTDKGAVNQKSPSSDEKETKEPLLAMAKTLKTNTTSANTQQTTEHNYDSDEKKKGGKVRVIVRARVRRATPEESNDNHVDDTNRKTDEDKGGCEIVDNNTKLLLPVAANNNNSSSNNEDSVEKASTGKVTDNAANGNVDMVLDALLDDHDAAPTTSSTQMESQNEQLQQKVLNEPLSSPSMIKDGHTEMVNNKKMDEMVGGRNSSGINISKVHVMAPQAGHENLMLNTTSNLTEPYEDGKKIKGNGNELSRQNVLEVNNPNIIPDSSQTAQVHVISTSPEMPPKDGIEARSMTTSSITSTATTPSSESPMNVREKLRRAREQKRMLEDKLKSSKDKFG